MEYLDEECNVNNLCMFCFVLLSTPPKQILSHKPPSLKADIICHLSNTDMPRNQVIIHNNTDA